jgi:hypothetical protein
MNRDYRDLTYRLGEPLWWDDQCVPRYDPFTPDSLGVYDCLAGLLEIQCQVCPKTFKVAVSYQSYCLAELWNRSQGIGTFWSLPTLWHYGDPPAHLSPTGSPCVGETMNCRDLQVLEFWAKKEPAEWTASLPEETDPESPWPSSWKRLPQHEVKSLSSHDRLASISSDLDAAAYNPVAARAK